MIYSEMDKEIDMELKEINNGDGTFTLCFEIPAELYKELTEILLPQGFTPEQAVDLYFREIVRLGKIPFEYTEEDIAAANAMFNL